MIRVLMILAVGMLAALPVFAGSPVIVADANSAQFGTVVDSDGTARQYMWFNVILSNTGGNAKIGGVSMAAMISGAGASHLSAPANFGPGGVNSAMRKSGPEWNTAMGGVFALASAQYPTSTSGVFGTLGSGGYVTSGIDNQSSLVTSVSNGAVIGRFYFGWDGQVIPGPINVSLIAESGDVSKGPSIFVDDGTGHIGTEVFSASSSMAVPVLIVSASADRDWLYQNAPVTTGDRHRALLTANVLQDTFGNTAYTLSATQSGDGVVSFATSGAGVLASPVPSLVVSGTNIYVVAGRKTSLSSPFANTGLCTVHVVLTGNVGGTASADVVLKIRPLGDVNDDGLVNAVGDKNAVTAAIRAGSVDPQYDINADGLVNAIGDLNTVTAIIRGTTVD